MNNKLFEILKEYGVDETCIATKIIDNVDCRRYNGHTIVDVFAPKKITFFDKYGNEMEIILTRIQSEKLVFIGE